MRYSLSKLNIVLLVTLLNQFAFAEVTAKKLTIPAPPPNGETPASLSCIYGLTPRAPGCRIDNTSIVPNTGSGIIVVTEGEHDPNAYAELTYFSQYFHLNVLPQCGTGVSGPCFQSYYAKTCQPGGAPKNASDNTEHVIDIEWAHAMAPNASIYMVETDSIGDMASAAPAVACANQLLAGRGGIVSNSWSFSEFPGETAYDAYFQTPGVIYFGSSGDYLAPARYPASSPNVIAAGGTMIRRDAAGNYSDQVSWFNPNIPAGVHGSGSSGGHSLYEPRPAYQTSVQKIVGNTRGTPDISFVAKDVNVFICDPSNSACPEGGQWKTTGGTSLAAPALAGIINSANSGATSSAQELAIIYNGALKDYRAKWIDIISGNNGFPCLPGYDLVTGLGAPVGYTGK